MSQENQKDQGLRDALIFMTEPVVSTPACPEPDRLWSAVRGELPARQIREIVDHISECAGCGQAWRLAKHLREQETPAGRKRIVLTGKWCWAAAAAAVILLAFGIRLSWLPRDPAASTYREPEQRTIRSLLDDDVPLPRDRCLLRWSPGPEGTRYDVNVATEELEIVFRIRNLKRAEHLVPEASLENLSSGVKLLWQVDAELPDGERVSSATFVNSLE